MRPDVDIGETASDPRGFVPKRGGFRYVGLNSGGS